MVVAVDEIHMFTIPVVLSVVITGLTWRGMNDVEMVVGSETKF